MRAVEPRSDPGTRDRLVAAAADVLARDGLADSRVEDIAEAAGCSRAAAYYHFGSKAELASAVVTSVLDELAAAVAAAQTEGVPEAFVGAMLRTLEPHLPLARLLLAELPALVDPVEIERRGRAGLVAPVRAAFDAEVVAGRAPAMDTDVVAAALVRAVPDALLGAVLRGEHDPDLDHLERELTALVRRALSHQNPETSTSRGSNR